jgi:hypothetical protein
MRKHSWLYVTVALAFVLTAPACEKDSDKKAQADAPESQAKQGQKAEQKDKKEEDESADDEEEEAQQPAHSSSIPGTENQLLWDQDVPEVSFEITNPKDGQVLESGDSVEVTFNVEQYRIGREIGQHIHFIPDNQPYIAHYANDEPLVLEDLEPGTHTIRAVPARHYHLSLKEGDVFETVTFHVEEKSEDFAFNPDEPYITYSRPKGTYSAAAGQELLLDYYVSNTELGEDTKVVYSVDGEKVGEATEWKPVLLPPMKPGKHKVNLKLVDGDGKVIKNGGYNDTTRTITVKEE